METLRAGASILLNSICFRPLPKSRYNFDYKSPNQKAIYIPIPVNTPSPAPATAVSSSPFSKKHDENESKNNKNTSDVDNNKNIYHVPCMLIHGGSGGGGGAENKNNNNRQQHKNVIIHFHGTSGDIVKSSVWVQVQNSLLDDAYDILCVEFPGGYGTASPRFPLPNTKRNVDGGAADRGDTSSSNSFEPFLCSRESLMTVARGVTDFLIQKMNIPENKIIFSGRSMGTGVAVELVSRFYPNSAGMLLLSPYASMSRVIVGVVESRIPKFLKSIPGVQWSLLSAASGLLSFLCKFGRTSLFEPIEFVPGIRENCAAKKNNTKQHQSLFVWIAHGKNDTLIPLSHAEEIVKSATQQPNHNNHYNNNNNNSNDNDMIDCRLIIDNHGTHAEVNYNAALVSFLNEFAKDQQRIITDKDDGSEADKNIHSSESKTKRLSWDEAPLATREDVLKLKETFKKDMEEIKKFKSISTKSFIYCFSAVIALSALAVLTVGVKAAKNVFSS